MPDVGSGSDHEATAACPPSSAGAQAVAAITKQTIKKKIDVLASALSVLAWKSHDACHARSIASASPDSSSLARAVSDWSRSTTYTSGTAECRRTHMVAAKNLKTDAVVGRDELIREAALTSLFDHRNVVALVGIETVHATGHWPWSF